MRSLFLTFAQIVTCQRTGPSPLAFFFKIICITDDVPAMCLMSSLKLWRNFGSGLSLSLSDDGSSGEPSSFKKKIKVFHPVPTDLVDRIFQIISEDVGHKWKELARALGVKEGQIDDLEFQHRSIADRVLLILDHHHKTCDLRRWRTELTTALATARRSDIALKVNNECDIHC